jgi:hypothetical protein
MKKEKSAEKDVTPVDTFLMMTVKDGRFVAVD